MHFLPLSGKHGSAQLSQMITALIDEYIFTPCTCVVEMPDFQSALSEIKLAAELQLPCIFVIMQVGARQWDRVLEMVSKIRGLGMEVCTTLGMLTPQQARELATAGLTAYNHNLDTSPEYYSQITSSRKYEVSQNCTVRVHDHTPSRQHLACM